MNLDLVGMTFAGAAAPLFGPMKLEVAPSEVLALVGPSGVGKTTLLRIIGGLEPGFQGRVLVGGQPAAEAPPPGFVFQDARLLPWLDAAGNIRAVVPAITDSRINELLDGVGLSGLARSFPRQLSGGMQRRLGLARALAAGSGLLLLDEPFVSLDRAVVLDLQALFLQVFAALHPTVILVSHDPEDAARLADRVVILSGRPAAISADFRLPPGSRDGADGQMKAVAMIRSAQEGGKHG